MVDSQFYIQLSVTAAVAVCGWIVAHWFTSRRDRKSAERKARLDALSRAYFVLVRTGIDGSIIRRDHNGNIVSTAKDVEDAIASIHLYGDNKHSTLANRYAAELQERQHGNATELVDFLREYLRHELGLPKLNETPYYVRIQISKGSSNTTTTQPAAKSGAATGSQPSP